MSDSLKLDFFIVGAPKCGTTSMNDYLRQHPQVFVPNRKELHYFGSDIRTKQARITWHEYKTHFARVEKEDAVGEASVWYLYSELAAQEIYDAYPDAKIIIMLRSPVQMLYSQHSEFLYNGNEDITDFESALAAEEQRMQGERIPASAHFVSGLFYRKTASFADQVERYFDIFGRSQVHVVLFDDFKAETLASYHKALQFLEIDPGFVPKISIHNQNKVPRRLPYFFHRLVDLFPHSRYLKALRFKMRFRYAPRPNMDPILKRQLQLEFAPEVTRLAQLLGRDLSVWNA